MALVFITIFNIIPRRIISLVFHYYFSYYSWAFYHGFFWVPCWSYSWAWFVWGLYDATGWEGIVDPVDATISQRCLYNHYAISLQESLQIFMDGTDKKYTQRYCNP